MATETPWIMIRKKPNGIISLTSHGLMPPGTVDRSHMKIELKTIGQDIHITSAENGIMQKIAAAASMQLFLRGEKLL
jgi:hypothetical protein